MTYMFVLCSLSMRLAGDVQSHSQNPNPQKPVHSRSKARKSGIHLSSLPHMCRMQSPEHAGLSLVYVRVHAQGVYQNITRWLQTGANCSTKNVSCLAQAAAGSCRSGSRTVCRPFCHLDSWPIPSQSQSQTRRGTP